MYHFIGIKGSGMSALAQIMKKLGYEVQGSDVDKYFFTQIELDKLGVKILPFDKNNITEDLVIVRGTTFNEENNEEVKKAKELHLTIYDYPEMLGELTKQFETIAICGTHGKTTTTGILSHVLNNTIGCNYLIGDGTGDASQKNQKFVIEACEYQKHFLNYHPTYTIITNIDLDHVDFYNNIEEIVDTFSKFANQTKNKVIACGDDENVRKLKNNKLIYYGLNDGNDIQATNIILNENGSTFDVSIHGKFFGNFNLHIYGNHMIQNVLPIIFLASSFEISKEQIEKLINSFKGVKRRFTETIIGTNIVIDDYAHHPNEIRAMIHSVRQKYPNKKLVTVFQPHTFSRTKEFYKEYIELFSTVDKSYFTEIYKSREKQEDYPNITIDIITDNIPYSEIISLEEKEKFMEYENSVILIMSPNELKLLTDGIKEVLEK